MSGARAKKKRRGPAREGAGAAQASPSPAPSEVRDTRSPGGPQGAGGVARPQPVWAPFPLTEIGMAAGLAIFVAGMLGDGRRATWLLTVAVLLLAVVVVELCLREHFAGYRSHTLLLAVAPVAILDGAMVRVLGDTLRGPLVLVAALALAAALGRWLQARFRAAHDRATDTARV